MSNALHIVCFDCPTPTDYGGAIDMYYRIKAFYDNGIKVHLHYFNYNERIPSDQLKQYCASINVYKRKSKRESFSRSLPYIVQSRISTELITHLNNDTLPVLLEGIHCTGILPQLRSDRKILIRLHDDECEYYKQLATNTKSILKIIYYQRESRLLRKYQLTLPNNCSYACIIEKDVLAFKTIYGLDKVFFAPAFIATNKVNCMEGIGDYCLYHGNLSVEENEAVAIWLIDKVFSAIRSKLIIAGKNPGNRLKQKISTQKNIQLITNPTDEELNKLISEAQINVLPAFSNTGIKFKLLHALLVGRHCIVNEQMINGTGLEEACFSGNNETAIASLIVQLQHTPFTEEEIKLRRRLFSQQFDNNATLMKFTTQLW